MQCSGFVCFSLCVFVCVCVCLCVCVFAFAGLGVVHGGWRERCSPGMHLPFVCCPLLLPVGLSCVLDSLPLPTISERIMHVLCMCVCLQESLRLAEVVLQRIDDPELLDKYHSLKEKIFVAEAGACVALCVGVSSPLSLRACMCVCVCYVCVCVCVCVCL